MLEDQQGDSHVKMLHFKQFICATCILLLVFVAFSPYSKYSNTLKGSFPISWQVPEGISLCSTKICSFYFKVNLVQQSSYIKMDYLHMDNFDSVRQSYFFLALRHNASP